MVREIRKGTEVKTITESTKYAILFDSAVNKEIEDGWTLVERGINRGIIYAFLERKQE